MNENNSTWGAILVKLNFFIRFWENWRYQKDISKLTDISYTYLIKYYNAINNKPVLNVLSKENMDSLLGDEGAFRGWTLKSWGLLSRGSDPLVLILRDIFRIVIWQQKYTQANSMSIQFTYYLSMQYLNCLDKALCRWCMYYLELAIWSECIIIDLSINFKLTFPYWI